MRRHRRRSVDSPGNPVSGRFSRLAQLAAPSAMVIYDTPLYPYSYVRNLRIGVSDYRLVFHLV